jgi:hypothetical protein
MPEPPLPLRGTEAFIVEAVAMAATAATLINIMRTTMLTPFAGVAPNLVSQFRGCH